LETACRLLAQWQPHHHLQHLVVSVNVSALQFLQADFVSQVEDCLRVSGAQPARLQLELTESMLVNDKDDIIEKMQALKALGILISLDDFGTGYSSLSYLQKLPLDQLKIDRSFIASLDGSDDSASLALTITTMGHSLGLEVIAEGVETQQQLDILKGYRCDLFQGYFTGYPVDAQAIERMAYDAAMHVIL
jgi:EAL domain-containing protein (putative c-di-GMP-specific phosphodiesterase class I)